MFGAYRCGGETLRSADRRRQHHRRFAVQRTERAGTMVLRRRLIRLRSGGGRMTDRECAGRRSKSGRTEAGGKELHVKAEDREASAEPTPRATTCAQDARPNAAPAVVLGAQTASSADAIEHPHAPRAEVTLAALERHEKTATAFGIVDGSDPMNYRPKEAALSLGCPV